MQESSITTMIIISTAVLLVTLVLVFTGTLPDSMRYARDVWLGWGLLALSIIVGLWRLRRERRPGRWIQLVPLVLGWAFLTLSISCAIYFEREMNKITFWS